MPIAINEITGEEIEVDSKGKLIRQIKPPSKVNVEKTSRQFGGSSVDDPTRVQGFVSQSKPPTTISEGEARRTRGEAIPLVTGAAGAYLGGPAGSGLGAFAGDLIKQELQNRFPQTFGSLPEDQEDPGGALVSAGTTGLLNFAGDKTAGALGTFAGRVKSGTVKDRISNYLMRSRLFGGDALEPEVREFLTANPDFPITHGQATGNKLTQFLEANLGGSKSKQIRAEQQDVFKNKFEQEAGMGVSSNDPERLGLTVASKVEEGFKSSSKDIDRVYNNLRSIAKQNTAKVPGKPTESKILDAQGKPVQTATENTIEGPVTLSNASNDANTLLEKIKTTYGVDNADDLLPQLEEEQRVALRTLRRFAEQTVDKSGKPIPVPLNVALDMKRITGNRAFKSFFGDMDSQRLQALNRNLDTDIRESIGKWDKNGPEALKQYALGNKYFQTQAQVFKETPAVEGLLTDPLGVTRNVKELFSDPGQLRMALVATQGDNGQTKKALKSEFLSDIFNSAFSKAEGKFSKGTAYELFTDRNKEPILRQLFTGEEANNLKRFFKTIDKVNTEIPFNSATSLGWSAARQGAAVAGTLLPFITSGDINENTLAQSGLILGAIIGTKQFTKNALLNPRMVRIATDLAQLPPDSYKAKQVARTLFQAMRGTKVTLELINGMTAEAEINSKGEIDPTFAIPKN